MKRRNPSKGIINPRTFAANGKNLHLCFYKTDNVFLAYDLFSKKYGISAFIIKGVYDCLIIHLDRDLLSLHYLLRNVRSYLEEDLEFTVIDFLKFEGILIDEDTPIPSAIEIDPKYLEEISLACLDWNHEKIPDEMKTKFLSDNSVLDVRNEFNLREGAFRRTFVLIALRYFTAAEMRTFESFVIEDILSHDIAYSFFKGQSRPGYNYILEMVGNIHEQDDIIWELHKHAEKHKLKFSTASLDVMKSITENYIIGLRKPSVESAGYEILCKLPEEPQFINEVPERILEIAGYYKEILVVLRRVKDLHLSRILRGVIDELIIAMFYCDVKCYAEPFVSAVETMTGTVLKPLVSYYGPGREKWTLAIKELNLRQKDPEDYTFGEALHAYEGWHKRYDLGLISEEQFKTFKKVRDCRNKLAHKQYGKVTYGEVETTFKDFLTIIASMGEVFESQ